MANFFSRVGHGFMNAYYAFVNTYNERAFNIFDVQSFDEYASCLVRYAFFGARYDNSVYARTNTAAQTYKFSKDLYKNIRELYALPSQVVELYTAKVFPSQVDLEDLSTGAIQVANASDQFIDALIQVYVWSNMQTIKTEYVRTGAIYGDVYLKVVDEYEKGRIRIEVLDPRKVKSITKDGAGNIKAIVLEYLRQDEDGKWYVYREEIDKGEFRFFKDDKPFGYVTDEGGNALPRYPNPYPFVPVVHVKHKDVGRKFGVNSFYALNALIDEINDVASLLTDQGRKAVNVLWYFFGKKDKEINASADQNTTDSTTDGQKHARDKVPALYGPKDGQAPFPMVAPIDMVAFGGHLDRLNAQSVRINPELALPQIRESGNLTAPGVMAAFSDGIDRIVEAAINYIEGLVRINKMAVTIGALRNLPGFEAFDEGSFERGDLDHFIKAPTVVKDQLSKYEKMNILKDANASIELILQELDYSEDIIAEEVARKEQAQREAVRQFASGTFGDDEDEDDDEPPTEEETEEAENARSPIAA